MVVVEAEGLDVVLGVDVSLIGSVMHRQRQRHHSRRGIRTGVDRSAVVLDAAEGVSGDVEEGDSSSKLVVVQADGKSNISHVNSYRRLLPACRLDRVTCPRRRHISLV